MNESYLTADAHIDITRWNPRILIGQQECEVKDLRVTRNAKLDLMFEFSMQNIENNLVFLDETIELQCAGQTFELIALTKSVAYDGEVIRFECALSSKPLLLTNENSVEMVQGRLLNLHPSALMSDVTLQTKHSTITLARDGDFSRYNDAVKKREFFLDVGFFRMVPLKGPYDIEAIKSDLGVLWRFLRFISGKDVGIGAWEATDNQGKLSAFQPSITRHDALSSNTNWSAFYCHEELPELFRKYQDFCTNENAQKTLVRAVEYYRASTSAQTSAGTETSIILAQSALELLSDFILRKDAGWTSELLGKNLGFHNTLSASAAFIGYSDDLLIHANETKKLFAKKNLLNDYHILTKTRNMITHSEPDIELGGIDLLNLWHASMFLIELHIFYLLDYRGQMADRRQFHGWFGDTISVPLKRIQSVRSRQHN